MASKVLTKAATALALIGTPFGHAAVREMVRALDAEMMALYRKTKARQRPGRKR